MTYLASRRGDYLRAYRGDPGFFGSLGRIVGGVAKTVGGIVPGPAGSLLKGVGGMMSRPRPATVARPSGFGAMPGRSAITGSVSRFQETGYRGSVSVPAGAGIDCPKGYRPNKTGYFTKLEGWVAPRSKCVKYRYRNVANGRALRRAIGRTSSFDKLVKRNRRALRALAKI